MKKEVDLGIWNLSAQHAREKKKKKMMMMIVVNPDDISTLPIISNAVGKGLIDVNIVDPGMVFIRLALWVVRYLLVEHRPQDRLAVP
jgi:hypothetical protein